VASLYLPLVTVVLENLDKLFSWPTEGESRIAGTVNPNEHLNLILTAISDNVPNAKGPIVVKEETTRHLLLCLLWVFKNVDRSLQLQWWSEMSAARLQTVLEILRICVSCFQYKVSQQGNHLFTVARTIYTFVSHSNVGQHVLGVSRPCGRPRCCLTVDRCAACLEVQVTVCTRGSLQCQKALKEFSQSSRYIHIHITETRTAITDGRAKIARPKARYFRRSLSDLTPH